MQDFIGIAEKLKRAEENINDLYPEMTRFFEECDYPEFPEQDSKMFARAVAYHKNLVVPPRFGVLAGEIIHHLRSCFDHVVWHFSTGPQKNNMPLDFPIFMEKPIDKNAVARFDGKIQRITNPNARALIERLQPYNSPDPANDALWLIHDFDITDKHREILLCVNAPSVSLPRSMQGVMEAYQRAHPELNPAQAARHFDPNRPSQPCIAFKYFGRRKVEPIPEGLVKLFNYTISAIDRFRNL